MVGLKIWDFEYGVEVMKSQVTQVVVLQSDRWS